MLDGMSDVLSQSKAPRAWPPAARRKFSRTRLASFHFVTGPYREIANLVIQERC
jgi:hypothetical protein